MRGQILSEKGKAYVEALRALGAGHLRILFMHVIPNSIYPILVQGTMDFGNVVLTFSALMFLGFSPTPLSQNWAIWLRMGMVIYLKLHG